MIRKIGLTEKDAIDLLLALGYATACASEKDADMHNRLVRLSDRILVQFGGTNYTYGRPRAEVIAELKADGIEIPEGDRMKNYDSAFPSGKQDGYQGTFGLTKREYLAVIALEGLLPSANYKQIPTTAAPVAVAVADALIAELSK